MNPMLVPPSTGSGPANKTPWVVPFFMVGMDDAKADVNCEVKHIMIDGVKVPLLVNSKKVKQTEELKFLKENWQDFESCKKTYKEPAHASKKRKCDLSTPIRRSSGGMFVIDGYCGHPWPAGALFIVQLQIVHACRQNSRSAHLPE